MQRKSIDLINPYLFSHTQFCTLCCLVLLKVVYEYQFFKVYERLFLMLRENRYGHSSLSNLSIPYSMGLMVRLVKVCFTH